MRRIGFLFLTVLVAGVLAATTGRANVIPNPLFSNGAVLQQGMEVPVWGTAQNGEAVTVKLAGQEAHTTTTNGHWMLRLKPLQAGGPFTMSIAGSNVVTVTNILVGEVWLCSGQSNMAWPLAKASNGSNAVVAAADASLRLLTVPFATPEAPQRQVVASWQACSPASAARFSAVGYFFGRDLRAALKVPIGLINASVGGTPAEAWTPGAAFGSDPELQAVVKADEQAMEAFRKRLLVFKAREAESLTNYLAAVAQAQKEGKRVPQRPPPPTAPVQDWHRPSRLYNGMIAPLQPYALRGVIWYQGESNARRARQYVKLFGALIGGWRQAWGEGEFPFLFVQMAPFDGMPPEIREAQLRVARFVPRTAMTVITDFGDAASIHPRHKEPVGERLALAARALAYGEKVEYSGPQFEALKVEGDRAVLQFSHVGGGLVASNGTLRGFEVAGADAKFGPAQARIEGETVVVVGANVPQPVAVRYGWANVPDVNLYNKAGLPASPFWTAGK